MDLTLRKAALEVMGWTFRQDDSLSGNYRWDALRPDGTVRLQCWASVDNMLPELPAIESDEGIAIRALVEWCNSHRDWGFTIEQWYAEPGTTKYSCRMFLRTLGCIQMPTYDERSYGVAIPEAICLALIKAAKGQSK